jgi:hypothetical protein
MGIRIGQTPLTRVLLFTGTLAAGFAFGRLWPDARLAAQPAPKADAAAEEVRARKLVLADDAGKTRGELMVDADGAPVLAMYDTRGRKRMQYGLDKDDRPGLMLWNQAGDKPEVFLGLLSDSTPALLMFDQAGKERLRIEVDPRAAEPMVALYHPDGRPAVGLVAGKKGPEIDVMSPDPNGPHIVTAINSDLATVAIMHGDSPRAALTYSPGGPQKSGSAALVIRGRDGKSGVTAAVEDGTGHVGVEVIDKTGNASRFPK